MDYKSLQAKAKELGLKYVGVSEKDLKKSIKEAESKKVKPQYKEMKSKNYDPKKPLPSDEDIDEQVETVPVESTEPKDVEKNADAVVYHGKRKVRTYTREQHGEDYVKLAEQYISHPEREGYRIEFETVETRLTCPNCGKKFRYN